MVSLNRPTHQKAILKAGSGTGLARPPGMCVVRIDRSLAVESVSLKGYRKSSLDELRELIRDGYHGVVAQTFGLPPRHARSRVERDTLYIQYKPHTATQQILDDVNTVK